MKYKGGGQFDQNFTLPELSDFLKSALAKRAGKDANPSIKTSGIPCSPNALHNDLKLSLSEDP